jgi:protein-tyrosine phosphatase
VSRWFRSYGFADVYDGLAVGALPLDREDVQTLERIGIHRILNLVSDEEYPDGAREQVTVALGGAGIQEHRVPVVDYGGLSGEVFEEAAAVVNRWLDEGLTVYVHCRAGWQRSVTVAAAILAVRQGVDVEPALRLVRSRRPAANPLPHQLDDLRRWWLSRDQLSTDAADRGVTRA